ncbi:MAG: DeoR/GlpR transcriptional regulator [Phycisphaerae bacterium]|nr:DeoR/GlpR transcriptional regulator [Phycisphaerae bacterium]
MQTERQEQMLEYLSLHSYLRIKEAIKLFNASISTIQRDFKKLIDKGLVQKVRGGIKLATSTNLGMQPFAIRQVRLSKEKQALAKEAVKLIKPGNSIFVGGGTTTYYLCTCLPNFELSAITNSFGFASSLVERSAFLPSLEIHLAGGLLHTKSDVLLGPNTEESLRKYHVDIAFISPAAMDESGLFLTNSLVMEAERIMIKNADKVVILADHSKIGKKAMSWLCGLDNIDILISNEWPDNDHLLNELIKKGLDVLKVEIT